MGAGASSLNFFKKAEEEMQNLEIVCYEKNKDVGGTWLENRYPGMSQSGFSQTRLINSLPQFVARELRNRLSQCRYLTAKRYSSSNDQELFDIDIKLGTLF